MEVFEQMIQKIRCIQMMDFYIKYHNKKLNLIPLFTWNDKNLYFHHPGSKMIPRHEIGFFAQSFAQTNFDVTQHFVFELDHQEMDYKYESVAKGNLESIIQLIQNKKLKNPTPHEVFGKIIRYLGMPTVTPTEPPENT